MGVRQLDNGSEEILCEVNSLGAWCRVFRPFAFPASSVPAWVGTLTALPLDELRWGLFALVWINVLLLHAAGNVLNEYFDFRFGVDCVGRSANGRDWGPLPLGLLDANHVLLAIATCLLSALGLGCYIVSRTGVWSLVLGLVGAFCLYSYSAPPFKFKYRAFGEWVIFICYGPALFLGAAYVQTGKLEMLALLLSFPVGILVVCILVVNNIRDYQEDLKGGRTLIAMIGLRRGRILYVGLLVTANVLLLVYVALGILPALSLLGLISAPIAIKLGKGVLQNDVLGDYDARTARYMALFSMLLTFGFLISSSM